MRVVLCLYDKYALRSMTTNRLSYVRTSVLRSKHYKLVSAAADRAASLSELQGPAGGARASQSTQNAQSTGTSTDALLDALPAAEERPAPPTESKCSGSSIGS